jgi:hypothetical protein
MKAFDKGVSYYTKATVEVGFPEDDICCYRCPLMGKTLGVDREICNRTGEILPAPRQMIGYECPLKFKEKDNDV